MCGECGCLKRKKSSSTLETPLRGQPWTLVTHPIPSRSEPSLRPPHVPSPVVTLDPDGAGKAVLSTPRAKHELRADRCYHRTRPRWAWHRSPWALNAHSE
jgi:hypothetical protein